MPDTLVCDALLGQTVFAGVGNIIKNEVLVHDQGVCVRCDRKLTRAYVGEADRRTFSCEHCQKQYAPAGRAG